MFDPMFDLLYVCLISLLSYFLLLYMHDLLNKEQMYKLCVYYKFW